MHLSLRRAAAAQDTDASPLRQLQQRRLALAAAAAAAALTCRAEAVRVAEGKVRAVQQRHCVRQDHAAARRAAGGRRESLQPKERTAQHSTAPPVQAAMLAMLARLTARCPAPEASHSCWLLWTQLGL